jgi:predicted dehydrogenase
LSHLYGYTDADWTITPAAGHEGLAAKWTADAGTEESSHTRQLAEVFDALDRGAEPPVTIADTRNTMEFVAAIYASAFSGRPIDRGAITPDHPFAGRMNGTGAPW